jgi:hypothetical protein
VAGLAASRSAGGDLTIRCARQNVIVGLNAFEFFQEDDARRIPRSARLCHISRLFHSTKARKQITGRGAYRIRHVRSSDANRLWRTGGGSLAV